MNDSNENKKSLTRGNTLYFLNCSLQETLLLTPAIIEIIFFWMLNVLLLSVEFLQKITPYYMIE
jgi:hypothetical protein